MKKFLYSFLGTVAGIWVSVLLGTLLLFLTIGVIAVNSDKSVSTVKVSDDSVLKIDLAGNLVDRATPISLMDQIYGNNEASISLNDIVDAIAAAKDDKKIKGIYLNCAGISTGLAQAQAITDALKDFKESGKWVYSYADTYSQADYYIASVSDSIFINPIGMIDIHGLSSTTIYFKDLLDKLGVEVQVVKVGTYKSAVEPFILNNISDANKEQQQHFLGNIWKFMRENIAKNRSIAVNSLDSIANQYIFSKNVGFYEKANLVDGIKYRHQMEDMIADVTEKAEDPDFVTVTDYLKVTESPLKRLDKNKKNIAVLYALGDITESGNSGITSDKLVPQILELAENKKIDGLVLRVNSGGGSAFASEQIWEALEQFKAISKKPFYVSMSDVAASGGYYISCGADKIYAEPTTLTGSIGIFGLIPNIQPLLKDKLGVNTYTVSTNTGSFPSIMEPMAPAQREAMQSYVDNGYELFVSRCAKGRKCTVEKIKSIAEGRVWDGQSALSNGLVDKLGGLQAALEDMTEQLDGDGYYISEYPSIKVKWWEMLLEVDSEFDASALSTASFCVNAVKELRKIDPLQCRMDLIKLH